MGMQDIMSRIGQALGGAAGFMNKGFETQENYKRYGPQYEEILKEQELQRARAAEAQKFRQAAEKRSQEFEKQRQWLHDKKMGEHAADMEFSVQRQKDQDFGEIASAGPPSETAFNEYRERAEELTASGERASADPDGEDAINARTQLRMMEASERDRDKKLQRESAQLGMERNELALEKARDYEAEFPSAEQAQLDEQQQRQNIANQASIMAARDAPDEMTPGEKDATLKRSALDELGLDVGTLSKVGNEYIDDTAMGGSSENTRMAQARKINAQIERVKQALQAQGGTSGFDPKGIRKTQIAAQVLDHIGVPIQMWPPEILQVMEHLEREELMGTGQMSPGDLGIQRQQ